MQNKLKIVALLAGALLVNSTYAGAQEDFAVWLFNFERTKEVKPVTNQQYQDECKECHFAYQPGLLPAKSWEKLLTTDALRDHFGDNAEMDKDTLRAIHDKRWRTRRIDPGTSVHARSLSPQQQARRRYGSPNCAISNAITVTSRKRWSRATRM